jgi:hypothetical protein
MGWDETCPDLPRRIKPSQGDPREMEELEGMMRRIRGGSAPADGLFSMARAYNCAGDSKKPCDCADKPTVRTDDRRGLGLVAVDRNELLGTIRAALKKR